MGIHLVGMEAKKSLLQPIDVVEYLLEIISRSMFVTVVGAELFMRMNLLAWQQNRALAASTVAANYDGAMEAMAEITTTPSRATA